MRLRSIVHRRRLAVLVPLVLLSACGSSTSPSKPSDPAAETYAASLGVNIAQMTRLSDALYILDKVVGTGTAATAGRTITVTYTGWLVNGTKFGSGTLDPFALGTGFVIPGWDQGIVGMRVGGTRRLVIGSALAYGSEGNGPIPPNSTLVFDVQLTSVK